MIKITPKGLKELNYHRNGNYIYPNHVHILSCLDDQQWHDEKELEKWRYAELVKLLDTMLRTGLIERKS